MNQYKIFDQDGAITSADTQYYNKHKAPTTRLNVKYQRMIMGAASLCVVTSRWN